jgi:hypothetical protein
MALFTQHYFRFMGESFRANSYKDDTGDRTCWVAQTKYGSTETVCKMNSAEAKAVVLAQARIKIKRAHANARGQQ